MQVGKSIEFYQKKIIELKKVKNSTMRTDQITHDAELEMILEARRQRRLEEEDNDQ